MRTQQDYAAAVAQLKRSIADLTDDHLAIFRERDPDFADRVEQARSRNRRGEDYQRRLAEAESHENYERDVRRRRLLDTLTQREACWRGMGEPVRIPPARRGAVRLMTAEQLQRAQDRARGVVRLDPTCVAAPHVSDEEAKWIRYRASLPRRDRQRG